MAVSFVKQKAMLVANWDEPLDRSAEGIYRVGVQRAKSQKDADQAEANSKAAWDKADKCVYGNLRHDSKWEKIILDAGGVHELQDIQILRDLAEEHGCGNCVELTAMTFMYLYNLNIGPLDFMALDNADHAFVVIGRNRDDVDTVGRNWDKSAVVCDPWAYGLKIPLPAGQIYGPEATFGDSYAAYSAALLEQNMKAMHPSFSGVRVEHREE
jgi:hypothetical protein